MPLFLINTSLRMMLQEGIGKSGSIIPKFAFPVLEFLREESLGSSAEIFRGWVYIPHGPLQRRVDSNFPSLPTASSPARANTCILRLGILVSDGKRD